MKKEIILGNLLLLTIMVLAYLFFHFTLKNSDSRAFNAGITMFIYLVFYFLGKAIHYSYLNFKKRKNINFTKILVSIFPLIISVLLSFLYMDTSFNLIPLLIAGLLIIIGFDYKDFIDKAFEIQLYKEMEISREYMPLYIGLYVVLATALLVFFPLLRG